jgi:alkylation response protein AidB-like acyl-CoA dehydrogenase
VANADSPVILSGAWIALGSATSTHIAVPVAKDQRESIAFISTAHDGVRVQSLDLVDVTRSAISVEINRLPIADADAVVSYDGLIGEWLHRVCLIAALDSAGLAREVLSRTLDYAQARVQFGRVIGSFQAYKHRCATLFIKHKLGQSLAFRAAKDSSTEGTMLALAAGLLTTQYATFIAGEAVQLHGGIGYTWEAGIHRFLKRARTNEVIARSDGLGPVLLLERYRTVRAAQE